MIRLRMALAAESISVDSRTNAVSLFGLLEEINTAGFPTLVPRVTALFVFERKDL